MEQSRKISDSYEHLETEEIPVACLQEMVSKNWEQTEVYALSHRRGIFTSNCSWHFPAQSLDYYFESRILDHTEMW